MTSLIEFKKGAVLCRSRVSTSKSKDSSSASAPSSESRPRFTWRWTGNWRSLPAVMSEETFEMTIERILRHCLLSGQRAAMILFHGGEPTLVGAARFDRMCALARGRLESVVNVAFAIQTNGTRLDSSWI